MSTSAQLVLTHGTSDLQILLRDEKGRLWRAMPDRNIVRRFHEWLLEKEADVEVIEVPPELLDRKAEATFTDWNGDTFGLWLRNESPDAQPERSPQGRLQLMLPKIEPALKQWLAEQNQPAKSAASAQSSLAQDQQNTGLQPPPLSAVLVLSTDRGLDEQEPVATYTFLKRWLMQKGIQETEIKEFVFLHPGERLESNESPIDFNIARRIEQAMRDFYDRRTNPTLLVASMGGLPQIKPLLAEMAVLLAGTKAQSLFKTEHGTLGLLPQTPIDALRVRRQCLEQVRRGALLDAWAMASPFHDDQDARSWVRPLEQAARLLNGNPVGERVELPALQRILKHAQRAACLLVAIRVETALQNERWLEAINGSLTFLETAIHDAINRWAKTTLEEYHPRQRVMRFRSNPPQTLIDNMALEKLGPHRPNDYRVNLVGETALKAWEEVLNNESIRELRATIYGPNPLPRGKRRPVDYRNFNTHGVMTQEEIDEAIQCFTEAYLWATETDTLGNRPKPGSRFLGRPLIKNVVDSLTDSHDDAQALYQALLEELEDRLIDPHSGLL